MQKRNSRAPKSKAGGARPPRAQPKSRSIAPDPEPPVAKARPRGARSDAMRLADEVEALKAELGAVRAKVRVLEARADTDPLTDLLNRRGFTRELRRSVAFVKRYAAAAALVYLDLDHFKPLNDRHGHAAGDVMLKAVAATLQRYVRASDVVARIGGDEFAVLLWKVTAEGAAAKAEMLERVVGDAIIPWGEAVLSVGASAGVAMLGPREDAAQAIERADRNMYARKAARRG